MAGSPFPPEHFERVDEGPDHEFYAYPRLVVHIDEGAIRAAGDVYAALLPANGRILDLMSSWRSHLAEDFSVVDLVGLGMNAVEMKENPSLTSFVVHDLNVNPRLPFKSDEFDGAIVTVSIQYLTRPLEVFADVHRVLRPGAPFVVTFSNRCFPTKAVRIWQAFGDREHLKLVEAYFRYSGDWADLRTEERIPAGGYGGDPLFAVHARKNTSPTAPFGAIPGEE